MDNADLAEQTAIANYIAGTVPDEWERKPRKADNGPPGASWAATVVDVATGRLQVRWLFSDPAGTDTDPGRRRLNMLATQAVDGLAIEAWGATKRSTRKAQKWEARPPDEDDGADDADAEAENRPQAFGEVAGSPGRGRRRTGRIADPTGEQAVANVLVGGLTERQRQVLELALAGHTQTEIGNQLQLAQSTVSTALSGIQKRIQRSVDISA
jgi:DNA-directed RNA polymerase specialized sigma24 family protein